MAWKVMDLMSQRYEFCHLAVQPGANISALCQQFGISRKTGYKWLQRFQQDGEAGLAERSRRPRISPDRTDPAVEARVLELKNRYPYWGPRKLHRLLQDQKIGEAIPARMTVARILQRHGLVTPRPPQPGTAEWQRFARPHPNDLWQMDLQADLRLSDGRKAYPVALLDDHSRYLLGLTLVSPANTDNLLAFWVAVAREHGLPQETLTDHGPQFRRQAEDLSAFRVYLWACGVEHIQGRIAHPQTQGKVERFFRTLNREVFDRHTYGDLTSWQTCLADWRRQYNQVRPHQELGDEVPARYYRPSDCPFVEPDRHHRWGRPDSQYRRVDEKGKISLCGRELRVGHGLAGWTVEARPLGDGCWHIYFKEHLIREYLLTRPLAATGGVPD